MPSAPTSRSSPRPRQQGVVFKDNGQPKPGLADLQRPRLQLDPPAAVPHADRAAQRSRTTRSRWRRRPSSSAYKFLLDFHYSDTWADPQKQFLPRAWEGMSHDELEQAVFEYTRDIDRRLPRRRRHARHGPDRQRSHRRHALARRQAAEELGQLRRPAQGRHPRRRCRSRPTRTWPMRRQAAPRPKIMIHIDRGGDRGATESFLNHCRKYGVEYDVIGQSYYPWWHGSLDNLRDNLAFMANEYEKDIILVEVAYNWRPAEYREKPGPFPETPEGQRQFLAEVDRIVRATPHGRGKGIFWWEPAVARSPIASRGMFDHDGNALPVITVFDPPLRVASPVTGE